MQERNHEIDGIRGWAALFVLMFHFFHELFQVLVPELSSKAFGFIFNGRMMVLIFFVLSGDALSLSFFSRPGDLSGTARMGINRYFRLSFPIVVSCLLAYFLMIVGLTPNIEAGHRVGLSGWLPTFLNFEPRIQDVLNYSIYGVYFGSSAPTYNPNLWTMSIEMLGSVLVIAVILVLDRIKYQKTFLAVLFVYLFVFSNFLSLFVAGVLLGRLRSEGVFDRLSRFSVIWLAVFLFLVGFLMPFVRYKMHDVFQTMTFELIQRESFDFMLAILIVFLSYSCTFLKRFFSNGFSRFLGRISFPMYVLQFSVLVSFSSILIIEFGKLGILLQYWWVIASSSVVVTIALSIGFSYAEIRFLKLMNSFWSRRVMKT